MKRFCLFLAVLIVTASAWPLEAAVEWKLEEFQSLSAKALDIAVSGDGRRTFVLLPQGRIVVFNVENQVESLLETGVSADRMELSPDASRLFLNDLSKNRLLVVALEYLHDVDDAAAPFRGSQNAPVSIVVFSEFQCPHCSRLDPLLDQLLTKYPEQVRVVFRNYPLRSHPYARHAALAALAAQRQDKFWPFHDLLFANQQNLTPQLIQGLADQVGLNRELYQQDIRSEVVAEQLNRDIESAKNAGVRGTPTIFVNGRLLQDRSIESFTAVVERELEKLRQ